LLPAITFAAIKYSHCPMTTNSQTTVKFMTMRMCMSHKPCQCQVH